MAHPSHDGVDPLEQAIVEWPEMAAEENKQEPDQ